MIIGLIISKFYKSSDGPAIGIAAAAVCAVVLAGGYSAVEHITVMTYTPRTLIFAVMGAFVGALLWHIVRSRFATEQSHTVRRSY